jgi:hypothetical protein
MSTFKQMLDFLSVGGAVDIETFNQTGYKSLEELFEEIKGLDVTLRRMNGIIHRVAFNVKVLLTTGTEGTPYYEYKEFKRQFSGGKVLEAEKEDTVSETRKRNETTDQALARCFAEELEIEIDPKRFIVLPPADNSIGYGTEHMSIRDSSVYPGIKSIVVSSRYTLHMAEPPPLLLQEINTISDNGSTIWIRREEP